MAANATSFRKGQINNPHGRPKSDYTLAAEAKKRTAKALMVLDEIMATPDHPQRLGAAKELLDRGWGKAPLVLAGEGGVGPSEIIVRLETPMVPISQ